MDPNGPVLNKPVAKSKNIQKFIHFGCWNNLNEGKSNLRNVVKSIKETLRTDPNIGLVVVAGDNYYPNKVSKKEENGVKVKVKTIDPARLNTGFDLVQSFQKENNLLEIDMIMGNHDYETQTDKNNNLYIESGSTKALEEGDCFITQQEMAFVEKDHANIDLQFYKSRIIGNHTLLVMMDTSIYTEDKEAKEYEKCMNVFLQSNRILSLEQIAEKQNAFITETIHQGVQQGIQKVVLIGHHPLAQWKMKEKEKEEKTGEKTKEKTKDKKPRFTTDIAKIFPVLLKAYNSSVQYYYLCADYHSFQQGSLSLKQDDKTMVIKQYISGTGGTELDDDMDIEEISGVTIESKSNDITVEYTLEKNQHEWGYLVCEPTATDLKCDFVPVPNTEDKQPVEKGGNGGKKSRKIKRRNRLSLKKRRKSHKRKSR